MARWTRLVGTMAAMLAALGVAAVAADRIFTNPKVEPHLRALFPKAVAFSPLEGTPLHFKAYAADPKATPNPPLLGYAFWTTDLVPNEYGYHGPIHILVGMDLTGILSGVIVDRSPWESLLASLRETPPRWLFLPLLVVSLVTAVLVPPGGSWHPAMRIVSRGSPKNAWPSTTSTDGGCRIYLTQANSAITCEGKR